MSNLPSHEFLFELEIIERIQGPSASERAKMAVKDILAAKKGPVLDYVVVLEGINADN